jgi:zinc protease
MLRSPRFDSTEFDVLRRETVTAIESQRSEPQLTALQALQRHLSPYPKGHPRYVSSLDEELADING